MPLAVISVFYVDPKTILPIWVREAKRLDSPAVKNDYLYSIYIVLAIISNLEVI